MMNVLLIIPLVLIQVASEDSTSVEAGFKDTYAIRALENCENSRRGVALNANGAGVLIRNETERGFRWSQGVASDAIARLVQTGVLYFPDTVPAETFVSVEDGGLRKIMVLSVGSCRFEMEFHLGGEHKKVLFEDVSVVPDWLKKQFDELLLRADGA